MKSRQATGVLLLGALLLLINSAWGQTTPEYDPMIVAPGGTGTWFEQTIHDAKRNRDIPVRIYSRNPPARSPVVLFSHGLGGSRAGCDYLGKQWADRGYIAVFLQHPGSDESVWKGKPLLSVMSGVQQAASGRNLVLRVDDVKAVIDQLENWNKPGESPFAGLFDLSRIGMSGHSFGAHTTQAVAGQQFPLIGSSWNDPRIKAAIMFSPSAPKQGDPADAFGKVSIPWMLMTGTKDIARIGGATLESRLNVFPHLPPGKKYELVLFEAEHYAFAGSADGTQRRAKRPRNPNHHRAILALSTAFWDAFLKDDAAARAWLDGTGPSTVLEPKDRWQTK